jgi:hypothetical protein
MDTPYFDTTAGTRVEYLSSSKGWVPAVFVGEGDHGDTSRCLIRIDGSEALSQVSRWSVRLPQPLAST